MLHLEDSDNSRVKTSTNESRESSSVSGVDDPSPLDSSGVKTSHCATKCVAQALLSTAIISIRDKNGSYQECRALLDSASQTHFMTRHLCQQLHLKIYKADHVINGIGQTNVLISHSTTTVIKSKYNNHQAELSCFVVDSITGMLPQSKIETCQFTIPKDILLADPKYNVPAKIDILIGVTLFYDLLQEGRISLGNNQPVLQKTKLGWIVGGSFMPCKSLTQSNVPQGYVLLNAQVQEQLERFWRLEEIEFSSPLTKEEQLCEDNFVLTHQRNNDGRFIVQLPLKDEISLLGRSREIAEKRLQAVERKLDKNVELKKAYVDFMQEYERLGHMSKVEETAVENDKANYLPHHAVIKSTNTTTKTRVVFDASCKTASGKSLNDLLRVGPTIQNTLFNIILRFRQHTYALTADINKMYL